jgi:hypothetical protein
MRYPCFGFPACLKTFENGYVLRAHQLSCEHSINKLQNENQRKEHARAIQYDYDVKGMKGNKRYPTWAGLDHTQKFLIRDRYQLGGNNNNPQESYRRNRQPPDPKLVMIQTKSTSMDLSGYYT